MSDAFCMSPTGPLNPTFLPPLPFLTLISCFELWCSHSLRVFRVRVYMGLGFRVIVVSSTSPDSGISVTDNSPPEIQSVWKDYIAVRSPSGFSLFFSQNFPIETPEGKHVCQQGMVVV